MMDPFQELSDPLQWLGSMTLAEAPGVEPLPLDTRPPEWFKKKRKNPLPLPGGTYAEVYGARKSRRRR